MKRLTFLLIILITIGCKESSIYTKNIDIPANWHHDSSVTYDFNINDKSHSYDMNLIVNYNNNFKYKNIYVKIITTFPNGKKVDNIVSLNIGNKQGKFLGECNNSSCNTTIPLQENFKFRESGQHSISISQHSREQILTGINAMTLTIKKTSK